MTWPLNSKGSLLAAQSMKLRVKSGEKDGKTYWDTCGVVFVNSDDDGEITSVNIKHSMFPGVEMVSFPKKDDENVQA